MGELKKEEAKDCVSNNANDQKSCKDGSSVSNFSLSDSDTSLYDVGDNKEIIEDSACRNSIKLLVKNIEDKQLSIKNHKNLIRDTEKMIKEAYDRIKVLENTVKTKSEEHLNWIVQENTLRSKVEDLDLELNQLFVSDISFYDTKNHKLKKELIESSGICGVYRKKLESLKEKINEIDIILLEKCKELNFISKKDIFFNGQILEDMKNSQTKEAYKVNDINSAGKDELFINFKDKILKNMKDVVNYDSKTFEDQVILKLKDSESKILDIESLISNLKKDYKHQKYLISEKFRTEKEEILFSAKIYSETVSNQFNLAVKYAKDKAREDLKKARELEHRFPSTNSEIDKGYKKFIVLFI